MTEAARDHTLFHPELVAAFADGELSVGEARVVQRHLADCVLCQRELALQQGLSWALGQEPAGPASAGLRRRIEQIGMPASRPLNPWHAWVAPTMATALVTFGIVGGAAFVSIGVGRATALIARRADANRPIAAVPLVRDAVADCRGVMARNFPRKADLQAVSAGLQFPVRALERPDAELFSTWKTTLAGASAAGLAYRWRGIVVVQYAVPAALIRQQPEMDAAIREAAFYSASEQGQAIVASIAHGRGTLLLAAAPPEELRRLIW